MLLSFILDKSLDLIKSLMGIMAAFLHNSCKSEPVIPGVISTRVLRLNEESKFISLRINLRILSR